MKPTFFLRPLLIFIGSLLVVFFVATSFPFTYLQVSDQPKGTAIRVDTVRLSRKGFVVVQTLDPTTDLPDKGGFLNIPSLMPKGIYKNIDLYLANSTAGVLDKVAVTIYEDSNENDEFDAYYDTGDDSIVSVADSPMLSKINSKVFRRIITLK